MLKKLLAEEKQRRRVAEERVHEEERDWVQHWQQEEQNQEFCRRKEGERLEQLDALEKELKFEKKRRQELEDCLDAINKLAGEGN